MGRPSTGAWTVGESLRIEMSILLKKKYLEKGCITYRSINWADQRGNDAGSINILSCYSYNGDESYIELDYHVTTREGVRTNHKYKIDLIEVDSNLGKGKVLYFLCPETSRKCRILYKAYGSKIFKSREAYSYRLYYDCQHSSKLNRYNDNYWRIESQLKKIKKEAVYGNRTYKGKLTKKAIMYNRLYLKQSRMDELRWTAGVPKALHKYMKNGRLPL